MNTVFPLGLPAPTTIYVVLYVLTFAIHALVIGYVLAGAGWLAVCAALESRLPDAKGAADVVRDWLPFALGVGITAGVAPLLFVQILYRESFYTANLLLFHRWMAIVPVLLLGFYLLYLQKSAVVDRRPRMKVPVAVVAFACFAFTGYSFVENHLLAIDRGAWVAFYGEGKMFYASSQAAPRFLIWCGGSLASFAIALALQLRPRQPAAKTVRMIALLGISGLVGAALGAGWLSMASNTGSFEVAFGAAAMPYTAVAIAAAAGVLGGWLTIALRPTLDSKLPVAIAGAHIVLVIAACAVREVWRLGHFDIEALAIHHERAAASGGAFAFIAFVAINAVVLIWCARLTRAGLSARSGGGQSVDG
jgi:hypothetical protein